MSTVRYCSACGHQNVTGAQFCNSCGQPMSAPTPPQNLKGSSGLRTTTMVFVLIAAAFMLISSIIGSIAGLALGLGDILIEGEESELAESVWEASLWGIFVSIYLFLGAGLSKLALKTSLILLASAMPMLLGLLSVDSTSNFAMAYYIAVFLVGVGIILMALAWVRERRIARYNP